MCSPQSRQRQPQHLYLGWEIWQNLKIRWPKTIHQHIPYNELTFDIVLPMSGWDLIHIQLAHMKMFCPRIWSIFKLAASLQDKQSLSAARCLVNFLVGVGWNMAPVLSEWISIHCILFSSAWILVVRYTYLNICPFFGKTNVF